MDRLRTIVAIVATFIFASAITATATDGDPLILGQANDAESGTSLSSWSELGEATLTVSSGGAHTALQAEAGVDTSPAASMVGYADALDVNGSLETDRAGVVVVPAGQTKVTFKPFTGTESDDENPVQADTILLATVQGNVGTSVLNVTLRPDVDTATIRLTRAVGAPVPVGWFTFRSYPR